MPPQIHLPSLDFSKHTSDSFAKLLGNEDLSDITLVSDDLLHVKAHKVVLSLSSPFFKQLIQANPHFQSVLYISGFNHQMLKHLVNLMYLGKVEEEIDDISVFMEMIKQFRILEHLFGESDSEIVQKQENFETTQHSIKELNDLSLDTTEVQSFKEDTEHLEAPGNNEDGTLSFDVSTNNYLDPKPLSTKRLLKLEELSCDTCKHVAKTCERLKIHKRKHEILHPCRFCSFTAEVYKILRKHIDDEHPNLKFKKKPAKLSCDHCGFIAIRSKRLKTHVQQMHMDKYPCEQCGTAFLTTEKMEIHIGKKHEIKREIIKCEECVFQTKFQSALRNNHREKHTDHVYVCDQCDYKTKAQYRITVHKKAKHEGKRFYCDRCDYSAPYREGLSRHVNIKHEGKTYQCDWCGYKATTNGNLKIHTEAKHDGKKYPCDQCNHQATQLGSLKIHRKKHNM